MELQGILKRKEKENAPVTLMIYLTWDEAMRVERAAPTLMDRLIVRLPLWSGLRSHEVVDARIEHFNPTTGCAYIPHGHKSGPRYAAVDNETFRLLAIYIDDRKKGPLFIRYDGSHISRYNVYYAIRTAGELAGINKGKPVAATMLRHTFATTWLKRKGNIRLLQKQLGHAKLESTAYYLDWMPEEVREEYARLFEEGKTQLAEQPAR